MALPKVIFNIAKDGLGRTGFIGKTAALIATGVTANIQENKVTESKSFKKEKEVKTQGVTFGGYLPLIFWILLLGTLIFLAWRLKLFRWAPIITKFKRLLKNI